MYRSDTKKVIPLTPVYGGESGGYKLYYYIVGGHLLIGQSAVFISGRAGTDYHVIHYITKNSESDYTDVILYSNGVATNNMNSNGNMYVYYWGVTEEIEACLIVA